jgi:hypothetical protein
MGIFDSLFGGRRTAPAGSAPNSAIPVGSIDEEYAWIRENCPGFAPGMQALQLIDDKPFDVLTCRNQRGEERTIYFDISAFYGQRKSKTGSPCPHCGAPLRTDKAKQCFECGANWRDP